MTFAPKSSCITFSCNQRIIYHHHRISSEKNHISCFWAQILQLFKWKKNTRVSMAEAKRWEEDLVQYLVQHVTNSILLTNVIILPGFPAKANKPNTMCFRILSFHNHTLHPPTMSAELFSNCQWEWWQWPSALKNLFHEFPGQLSNGSKAILIVNISFDLGSKISPSWPV